MITIISGTNRQNSNTLTVARHYYNELRKKGAAVQLLSLTDLPENWLSEKMYNADSQPNGFAEVQDQYWVAADKIVMISPEYNGSFPGVLKAFLDACSVRNAKESFFYKKVALVGVSSGRAGNLRGMEHLTGVLNYLNMIVMPNRLPISVVNTLKNEAGELANADTLKTIDAHIEQILVF
jgi:chromate reductase